MGLRGPAGKRDEERRRRNKDGVETTVVDIAGLISEDVEIPVADPDWEPLTKSYWDSFARSGQSVFYEPSDWMTAYALMQTLDSWLKPQDIKVGEYRPAAQEGGDVVYTFEKKVVPMPGATINAILKGLTSLMATEGDRRRLSIELERTRAREEAAEGTVTDIAKRREDAFKGA